MQSKEVIVNESPRLFVSGGRDYSVDILRCVSCFMVVMIHACRFSMPYYGFELIGAGSDEWYGIAFCMSIVASPTVLFVMVSGIFFLTPQRYVTPRKVWTKNIPKMACAYIVWSLAYALYNIWFVYDPQPEITFKLLCQEWIKEPGHMWYIPMIITLYMLCPFFRCITKVDDTKLYKYGLILFLSALLLNTIVDQPEYPYMNYLAAIVEKTPVADICQYSFWMVYGYAMYTYRPSAKARKWLYLAGIAAIFVSFAVNVIEFQELGYSNGNSINSKFTITTFFKNTALFVLITNGLQDIKLSEKATKFLSKLSNSTLMIYLIHWLFLDIFFRNRIIVGHVNQVAAIWIVGIIVYVLGFLSGFIFQAVPWKKMRNAILDKFFPNRTVLVTKRPKH